MFLFHVVLPVTPVPLDKLLFISFLIRVLQKFSLMKRTSHLHFPTPFTSFLPSTFVTEEFRNHTMPTDWKKKFFLRRRIYVLLHAAEDPYNHYFDSVSDKLLDPFHLALLLEHSCVRSFGACFFVFLFWLSLCVCLCTRGISRDSVVAVSQRLRATSPGQPV